MIKLNLGSGNKRIDGYVNLDKFDIFNPEYVHDLETFPYPFKDNEVSHIMLSHVLEHIGQNPDIFNNIMKELYRICCHEAEIDIIVPHPRHDDYLSDPTHVRPITALGLALYDLESNTYWIKINASNTPLAMINKVNFKIINTVHFLEESYDNLYKKNKISKEDLEYHIRHYNNVIKQTHYKLKVIKKSLF